MRSFAHRSYDDAPLRGLLGSAGPIDERAFIRLFSQANIQHLNSERLICAGETLCISPPTWHSASDYTREDGQHYTWGFAFGHGDHAWKGVCHYTNLGHNANFRKFISGLSAKDRELFRFPPAGHPYYTAQTLAALEEHYSGWNAGNEYASAHTDHS